MAAKAAEQRVTFGNANEVAYLHYRWQQVRQLLSLVHKLGNIPTFTPPPQSDD